MGGIPGRGVDMAIGLIDDAWHEGYRFAAGSDIKSFFTKIPKADVLAFLSREIFDEKFIGLIERALTIELRNAADLSEDDLALFPLGPGGVAQGSPLSALAGNIVLRDFDHEMNQRGLICIRYIDDFVLLGKKFSNVRKGMDAAGQLLRQLGMDIYDPSNDSSKAFIGPIDGSQTFLGYKLEPSSYPPSPEAQEKLKARIERLIREGQATIRKVVASRPLKHTDRAFAPTIVAINNTLMGWKGSFKSSNSPEVFQALDKWTQGRIADFEHFMERQLRGCPSGLRAKALGVSAID